MIKMKNLLNGNEWTWDRAKFTDRRFQMQELYQRYLEEEDPALLGPPATKVSFAKHYFYTGLSLLMHVHDMGSLDLEILCTL